MEILKNVIKYIIVFLVVSSVLFVLLVSISKIPKKYIQTNLEESADFFEKVAGIEEILKRREYSTIYYFGDSVILNIINCIDTENVLDSTMWCKYVQDSKLDVNYDFVESIRENKTANNEYLRYWHGSMVFIRPLLMILNIEQIYLLNTILINILALLLFFVLIKKDKKLAIVYVISLIMVAFKYVPYCFEYVWTFYIMLIASIICVKIEKSGNKNLYMTFFISGILTCFLDFLTTQTITFLVPILFVLILRKKEGRLTSFSEGIKFVVISCVIWAVGYAAMWILKWVMAFFILNINVLEYVKDNAMLRVNGLQGLDSYKEMYIGAIANNFFNLYPINIIKNKSHLLVIMLSLFVMVLVFIDWKNIKKKWFSMLLLFVALIPYFKYLVLANHSYRHAFFTFREQMSSSIALMILVLEILNYKLLFKKIKWKKGKKVERSRINNINSLFK